MSDLVPDAASPKVAIMTPKMALLFVVVLWGVFFLLNDVVGLMTGGGIFSISSAFEAARIRAGSIDVDDAGLRSIFVALCGAVVLMPCSALKPNLNNRWVTLAILLPAIGGGFIIDTIYDQRIVSHFLAGRGYSRCENGDYHRGAGKSRVWFDDYVLNAANCPSTPR